MFQYKYCSNCGELFNKINENYFWCPKCDFRIYDGPRPAAGVILTNQNGQVLMTKRSYDPGKGKWGIPGGFLEKDETLTEALTREIKEETGIAVAEFTFFGSFTSDYPHKGVVYKVVNSIFKATLPKNSEVKLSDESTEFRFFDSKDILIDELAPDDLKKAMRLYLKLLLSK